MGGGGDCGWLGKIKLRACRSTSYPPLTMGLCVLAYIKFLKGGELKAKSKVRMKASQASADGKVVPGGKSSRR